MENKGLLFIPDISGFTKFVNQNEVEHSRLIIQELLEILIDANQMGLNVSEIEGDAILFYKYGSSPSPEELYSQVEKMFCEFNRHLLAYDISRYCMCKACNSAIDLKLKIISHYGEFTSYKVKDFSKLIGRDVIVAHQLLKNEIVNHEYWLLTKNVLDLPPGSLAQWMKWNSSKKETENGDIPYYYTELYPLKKEIKPEPFPVIEPSRKTKMVSVSKEYETDIITLFHATGDFQFRHRWMEGVKKVEEYSHFLPRVGMKCRCIMENGETIIYSTSYSYDDNKIEFSETDEKKEKITHYILEKVNPDKVRLTINFYLRKNLLAETMFKIREKNELEHIFNRSLSNLSELVKELNFAVTQN